MLRRCLYTKHEANHFFVITAFILAVCVCFMGNCASADNSISISVASGHIEMELMPGQFGTEDETVTVTTSNIAGYRVLFGVSGSSNSLINIVDNTLTVPTFELPQGSSSIPVSSLGYGYGYSLDSGDNFYPSPAPSDSVKIFESDTAGTFDHTLTYGAKPSFETVAGTYENTFVLQAVAKLEPCDSLRICYYGNGDDETGTMEDQVAASNTSTTLIPSNFSRPGYGFAGWNTELDGSGTTYGPSQAITTGDLSVEGLQLYAKWVPSAGTFQSFSGCTTMNPGEVTALTDNRDNNTYAIAKMLDGQCWMIENLRLDLSDPDLQLSSSNTNNPGADFVNTINTTHPAPSNSFCESTSPNAACVNQIAFNTNNIDRSLTASYNANNNSSSWYSYGVYYNWYTATTGYGSFSFNVSGSMVEGDICPAGWRLPTGFGEAGDYSKLDVLLGGNGRNQSTVASSERWRAYPLNYIYSGEQRGASGYNRDVSSGFSTSNTINSQRAVNFWLQKTAVNLFSNSSLKPRGQTVRCVFNNATSSGTIHYDSNGGEGTMADELDVDFASAVAANNDFTRDKSEFMYWNTKADGSGTIVFEGGRVATAASQMEVPEGGTLTLYAIWRSVYTINYLGNGSDGGTMGQNLHGNLSDLPSVDLIVPNYSRTGFGFIGWSFDSDAATKFLNGQSVKIYGPNEKVTLDAEFYSHADSDNRLKLYAVWIQADSNYTMQSFGTSECSVLQTGEILALEDTRDSSVYAVAKLGDGKCWMIENLRLDPSQVSFSSLNTNSPTSAFITEAANSSSKDTLCGVNDSNCVDTINYNANNINRSLTPSHLGTLSSYMWYGYGVMYNWYTASAGNGNYSMSSGSVVGDLCPAGWRLPVGGSSGEYVGFNRDVNNGSLSSDVVLRNFPNNFIYSGDFNKTAYGGRGTYGRFWSSTAANVNNAFRFGFTNGTVTPNNSYNKWDAFAIRCIVK